MCRVFCHVHPYRLVGQGVLTIDSYPGLFEIEPPSCRGGADFAVVGSVFGHRSPLLLNPVREASRGLHRHLYHTGASDCVVYFSAVSQNAQSDTRTPSFAATVVPSSRYGSEPFFAVGQTGAPPPFGSPVAAKRVQ